MPAIGTGPREYDRKLHRIVMFSKGSSASNSTDVARLLRKQNPKEFSYIRDGQTRQSTNATIEKYVTYAHVIKLLDGSLSPNGSDQQIFELEAFQDWLGDLVIDFLSKHGCRPNVIRDTAIGLLSEDPQKLPSIKRVHSRLPNPPQYREFDYSVRIVARLRPAIINIRALPAFLFKGVLEQ